MIGVVILIATKTLRHYPFTVKGAGLTDGLVFGFICRRIWGALSLNSTANQYPNLCFIEVLEC